MKEEKDITPMDFAECLRKSGVQRTAKLIEMKSIVILVKVDQNYNI